MCVWSLHGRQESLTWRGRGSCFFETAALQQRRVSPSKEVGAVADSSLALWGVPSSWKGCQVSASLLVKLSFLWHARVPPISGEMEVLFQSSQTLQHSIRLVL